VTTPPSSSERGAAAIEFAISVIVLAVLIFGSIGVTMAFYTYEVVNQYARDASRFAIVHGNGCSYLVSGNPTSCSIGIGDNFAPTTAGNAPADIALRAYLNNEIYPGINGANLTVTTNYAQAPGATTCNATNCNGAGDQVTVNVAYPYLYNIPLIPSNLINMHGTSTMVISQ
jgi:TadE-like protein